MVKCCLIICHHTSSSAREEVCVHLIVGVLSVCGLTPVGNRLSRLILLLPAPVDRVSEV